jgi:hypothetical protein
MRTRFACLSILSLLLSIPAALQAAPLPCKPCAGLRIEPSVPAAAAEPLNPGPVPTTAPAAPAGSPATGVQPLAGLLRQVKLEPSSPLFVAWEVPLSGGADVAIAKELADGGATPWISLVFRTPAPLAQNAERLQAELREAARLAGDAPASAWFQVIWRPEGHESDPFQPTEYAFLLKRAAVALTGAHADARVATDALPANPAALEAFYGEEVAAYLEAVVLRDAGDPAAAITSLDKLDPGRPVVLDAVALPADPAGVLAEAARRSVQGIDLVLFHAPAVSPEAFAPFVLLAREFAGDLSYDPESAPAGAAEAWTFVRGKDLGLRVIARLAEPGPASLVFPDPYLKRPVVFPFTRAKVTPPAGEITGQKMRIRVDEPGSSVVVLGLERATAAERSGVAEKVQVSSQRDMPVEEILRRLQAFEDAQDRRLDHYQAVNTTHLRFQPAAGSQTFEATLQGPFFFSPKTGSDWAWQTLYVNGVKWRSKTIPEIPLVQPEKAAAMPLAIHFSKQYRYRLRGTDKIDGRDAWVVDFAPSGTDSGVGGKLYQGTVWVDRQIYARLRTRAVQVGLQGEVLSNEETMQYSPIDETGKAAPWSAQSYVLPLRIVAQQILSVVDATTVVERQTDLTEVRINAADFEQQRAQTAASDVTMVRDTDKGLRYLDKDDSGERVVREGFNRNKLFAVGGVFYDDALAYPLPLAGLNYFSFDFKGTGKQLNVFFAGALLQASAADPRFLGSRFDLGANLFALAIATKDELYRDGEKSASETIQQRVGKFGLKLGHPLGNFVKLDLDYDVLFLNYSRADDTAKSFVVPSDNLLHSIEIGASFSRAGYGLSAHASYSRHSQWTFWGLPGNTEYSPDSRDFMSWDARASKNWYLPRFQKIGAEVDYVSGSDLDRFSKYQFGFFGSTRVHGYQSGKVRAEEAVASHFTYGFEVGKVFRIDAVGDAAWATDKTSGLDRELLGGVGIAGTFVGPWQTVVNLDVGVPVAGPDDGFVLYVVFLKLFK